MHHVGISFGRVEHWHDGLGEFSQRLGFELATRAAALRAQHGITPRVRMELSSNEAIKQALLDRLGVAFLSHDIAGEEPGLRALDVVGLPVKQAWLIAHPKTRPLSQIGAAFLEYVLGQASKEATHSFPAPRAAA